MSQSLDCLYLSRQVPRRSNRRVTEPRLSVWFGIPTIVISIVAIVLLGSYYMGRAIGPPELYTIERVRDVDDTGHLVQDQSLDPSSRKFYLPSMLFMGSLVLNACVAGLGIYLCKKKWQHRPVWMSATALILNTAAFLLIWLLWLQAAT